MSGSIKGAAVYWNEDPDKLAFLLEELCCEMKESELANPVVIDCRKGNKPPHFFLSDCRNYGIRSLKGIARGEIPYLLPAAAGTLAKGDLAPESYFYLFLTDEESIEDVYALVEDVLFLCRANSDSVSVLFRLVSRYRFHTGRCPRFHVFVSGLPKIEDAAQYFVTLRDEIVKLGDTRADLLFGGFCAIDFEKIEISRSQGLFYRDSFKGDSFYGQLLYSARNFIKKTEPVETDLGAVGFIQQFIVTT